ncbi:hypothetical protein G7077_02510 [Sphingomonas piscis]|uniref:Tail specific protease domain-containing protein n=1 Tax=Sphingomonas piscis TaxID=2714943 RepID=A0A6G7YMJ3_9SPHN|nr:S41 family peptidase [Sphingomonas piscis]QIK77951.1 hypothetical protein G7077_02510 [Sphingomonas piscis]
MRNSVLLAATAATASLVLSAAASAQPITNVVQPAKGPAAMNSNAIAEAVRDAVKSNYVLADKVPLVTAALDKGIAEGRYQGLEGGTLAERLNQDLAAAAHDKHLSISFDPVHAAMLKGPMSDEITEGPEWERMARGMNHGIAELRLMDGNVRYMNLVGFAWTGAKSAAAIDNAMRFLADGDAAVIDLRYNGGGSPKAIQYLFSHFVAANKPLMTFYFGGGKAVERDLSLAKLPAGRMKGKPLYILTSNRSISAAEAFAALVKDYGVGDIVGETTAGAAYRNSYFPIAGQYMLSVSVARGEVGPSRVDWEGTGIAPTIKANADDALDMAHMAALEKLGATAAGPEKAMMLAKAAVLKAKLSPVKAAHDLPAYVGRYQDRAVTVDKDALYSQRTGGPRTRLLAVGGDAFIMESDPLTRVEYVVADGKAVSMEVIRADGSRQKQPRTD